MAMEFGGKSHVEVIVCAGRPHFYTSPTRTLVHYWRLKRSRSNSRKRKTKIRKERVKSAKMVGLPYDCLANPLGAVRLTFERAVSCGSDPVALDGKDWGAAELFRQFLFDDGGLSQVCFLSLFNDCTAPNLIGQMRIRSLCVC